MSYPGYNFKAESSLHHYSQDGAFPFQEAVLPNSGPLKIVASYELEIVIF